MKGLGRLCPAPPFYKGRTRLVVVVLYALVLSSARTLAQPSCGTRTQIRTVRVQDATGVGILRAALNCTGGAVEAYWVGRVVVDAPIVVEEGTFLSVTGEDDLAEVHADGSKTDGTRLFEVDERGGLILTGLKVSGGSAGGGGAIYSRSATLNLDRCTFDSNDATDGSGGAIWADGGIVTIVGGQFSNNTATDYGGAVHAVDGALVVQGGSRFEDNAAAVGGGALFCGLGNLGAARPEVVCSITDATFVSNTAARESQDDVEGLSNLDGGGAAMFLSASVDITSATFSENYALLSGGALHGGFGTNISVNGCTFVNNTSGKYAGAISASTMTLGGGTRLVNNTAWDDGGAVVGWNNRGTIVFNDVLCSQNTAENNGGCFYGAGRGIINDGTAMTNNSGAHGGSILAFEGSHISVRGGHFSGGSSTNGAFIYAQDNTRVTITSGLIEENSSSRRGGAIYVNGNEASDILIEGGVFKNNEALESGGAIAVWGDPSLVNITGGTFEGNHATFYGGFAFVEGGGSLKCEGATVRSNRAYEQGGAIYARQATWVYSSCDLIENESPQGAAIYLTNVKSATFEDHNVTNNVAMGGSVVYLAASSVVARYVTLDSRYMQDHSFNRAIQMDGHTTLDAGQCIFDGWRGDTVILNLNPAKGSLVLTSCDFRGSSANIAVTSPNSDAEIRNAVVSSLTFENAVASSVECPMTIVDRALNCTDSNACGSVDCVDSPLGVLCDCLKGGECLNDGGKLSLEVYQNPDTETFSPDSVKFVLAVSAGNDGTTSAVWKLEFVAADLDLDVVPSSGVLPPGGSVQVSVTGTPSRTDVGGNLISRFSLKSVGNASSAATVVDTKNVTSAFYVCPAYEYATPLHDDDNDGDDGVSCQRCSTIVGEEAVNCTNPGATQYMLPVQQGYWRSSNESLEVLQCLHSDACAGATEISSSDGYCTDGYEGPYCAVCADGYGRGVSHACHSCNDANTPLLVAAGALFSLVMILLLGFAVVFLIGGLDAIDTVHQSFRRKFSEARIRPGSRREVSSPVFDFALARSTSKVGPRVSALDKPTVPVFSSESEVKGCGGGGGVQVRCVSSSGSDHPDGIYQTNYAPFGDVVEAGIELSDMANTAAPGNEYVAAHRNAQISTLAGLSLGSRRAPRDADVKHDSGGTPRCCGLGKKTKRWVSILPLDKIKILVVVWQILVLCSSITGVEFPASYAGFLSWISVVNFDIGNIFSASCILPAVNFYARLLLTTLLPLMLAAVLVLTYHLAKRRAGIGRAGVIARRAAWSRHVAAGLLLTFLVFTSVSTVIFKTFACDDDAVKFESYLREDYSLSCATPLHRKFELYAGLMILVYPIGIPVLYAAILWKNRELLNPRIRTEPEGVDEDDTEASPARGDDKPPATLFTTSKGQTKGEYSFLELQQLEEKVKARRKHPELVPSMFLWKDFGPDLYYYEVIECGRRMLLTGVLIFIAPRTASQVAMACIFAFASLLGFEIMRPHMDPADSWLYRMGCVIIFLSNFLALLIKVDAGRKGDRDVFGGLLVAINVLLVLAVLLTSWFAVQQSVDDSRGEDSSLAIAKAMLTAEQFAAESARLTRERGRRAPISPAFFSVKHEVPPPECTVNKKNSPAPHTPFVSGATELASERSGPGLTSGEGVDAATLDKLQHQSQTRIDLGS